MPEAYCSPSTRVKLYGEAVADLTRWEIECQNKILPVPGLIARRETVAERERELIGMLSPKGPR